MYRVIKYFTDLQDGDCPYNVGDIFPRKGLKVTDKRLAELAGNGNKQGVPLIQFVEETPAVEEEPKKAPTKRTKKAAEE